jgi:TonB family protein
MTPASKDNEVLTAIDERSASVSTPTATRAEEITSRPQPVALEVPVTVNGARTVEGSDKREPFSETTKTVLVFGNGAVIRLGSPVSPGQLLFLTNEKTKKEVVCQVVKSKNYRNVSGYVELEFTESVVGFWGMRFPADRIAPHPVPAAPAARPPAKVNSIASIPAAPKVVSPAISAIPKAPEISPAQIRAELKPAVSVVAKPVVTSVQSSPASVAPVVKDREIPVNSGSPITASLVSSVASLLGSVDAQPHVPSNPAVPVPSGSKQVPASDASLDSTEALKLHTARLQEQLSSMLFSEGPIAKHSSAASILEDAPVSGVAAKLFELASSDAETAKAATPVQTSQPPVTSSFETEAVKIPSWLEPLARNAAIPAPPVEPSEQEKARPSTNISEHEEIAAVPLPLAEVENATAPELPNFGGMPALQEEVLTQQHPSGGSGRGIWIGAIAAGVLAVAGGAWYLLHPSSAVQGTSTPTSSAPRAQSNAALTEPASVQPAPQNSVATPEPSSRSNEIPASRKTDSGARDSKPQVTSPLGPITRDNTRGAGNTIPAAVTERISRAAPEPAPKKPALGEVHLASPKMNRSAAPTDEGEAAPTLANGAVVPNVGGLDTGLSESGGKQPAAPEAALPIGGDVQPARLISHVAPLYPILAKNQHVSGDVVIDALIDVNGRVTTMKVISGPTLLHQAAKDALRQWRYQAASLDGKAVAMHLTVTLQFRLQ